MILPNPDAMWKTLPTDPTAPFPKADAESFGAAIDSDGPISILAASRRGRSHANEGKFRDDHFTVDLGSNAADWKIFAVADGAGSAQYSREGSRIACETSCSSLRKFFTEYNVHFDEAVQRVLDAKSDWQTNPTCDASALHETNLAQFFCLSIRAVWEEIKKSAEARNAKINDFSTTLQCVAIKRFPATETRPVLWAVASYWVGDGGAAILRPNGKSKIRPLGTPDGGEFAGQTRFVTTSEELTPEKIISRLRLNVVETFQSIALMSDGVADPFFPAEINIFQYKSWKTFWDELLPEHFPGVLDVSKPPKERAEALLAGLNFFIKGNHDDRTVLLVINDQFSITDESNDSSFPESEETPDDFDSGSILIENSDESNEDSFCSDSLQFGESSSDEDSFISDSSLLDEQSGLSDENSNSDLAED